MKQKLKWLLILILVIEIILFFVYKPFFLFVAILFAIFLLAGMLLLVLNALYKRTNHWKNQFIFEKNFISNLGYRDNLSRNLDVVNLGSNPALFGLFYEKVRGQNWATGSQGLEMDFEILKYFHSYVRDGGIVLLPIMPFTAISQYIKTKKGYWNDSYYIKFAKILDASQVRNMPGGINLRRMSKYPLVYNPKLLRYILVDVPRDCRLEITEQTMSAVELEQDAGMWINGWKKEFDAVSIKDFTHDQKYLPYRKEAVDIVRSMIEYCESRNLKPVLITIPMSRYLADKFDADFRRSMIDDFVKELGIGGVEFLDYMFDPGFDDPALYNGSFFLNLKGRKLFSSQVMKDLQLQ